MDTKFEVMSAALVLVGDSPVSAFSASGTPAQKVGFYLWDTQVGTVISSHPWRFATKDTLLSRDVTAPTTKWDATYAEPTGAKTIKNVYVGDSAVPIEFDRLEGKIHCNATATDSVYAEHTFVPSVTNWPDYFEDLVVLKLAGLLAVPAAANLEMSKGFKESYADALRVAKHTDSMQQTNRRLKTAGRDSLMEFRRHRGAYLR